VEQPQNSRRTFQRIGSSNVSVLCGLRASIELASEIGMERIEKRHRQMAIDGRSLNSFATSDRQLSSEEASEIRAEYL